MILEKEEAVKRLVKARKALERGKYRRALRLLDADHYLVTRRQLRKITEVKAVARLRLGKHRVAERYFRHRLRSDKDNPFLLARLAESLSFRSGEEAIEAWRILNDLEKRDLIPDAHGYATLARLRKRAGDTEGYQRATAACHKMARNAKICAIAAPSRS